MPSAQFGNHFKSFAFTWHILAALKAHMAGPKQAPKVGRESKFFKSEYLMLT